MAAMVGLATALGMLVVPLVAPNAQALVSTDDSVVSAEMLPTAQINGVVWSQGMVGKTVVVGGQFTSAKDVGSSSWTTRNNLMAFNIDTGNLVAGFNPNVNGAVKTVAVSPDGKRVYIGGSFTKVGTANRYRLAAFDVATNGTLTLVTSFAPSINASVKAIVATNDRVYIGGDFSSIGGNARARLAAFDKSGALTGWNPSVDATVGALTITPDGSKVIAGGSFTTINTQAAYGMGAIGATDGLRKTWNVNTIIKNATTTSSITSLSTAGGQIIGTGYDFGSGGNFEGTFAADPASGDLKWMEDCHGDTYAAFTQGSAVYTAGHAHDCTNVAGFPEVTPRVSRRALAFTATATGTLTANTVKNYSNFGGRPAPSQINWFPELSPGTFTGQTQAAWSVTGNADYIVYGGEFPKVNGKAQQGLVRFATRKPGTVSSAPALNGSAMGLTAVSLTSGQVRVSVPANYDKDDTSLDYKLYRDGVLVPGADKTVVSTFFNRPYVTWLDNVTGTHTYKITVTDGQTLRTSNTLTVAVGTSKTTSAYSDAVNAAGAGLYWRLGESSGTKAFDWSTTGADGTVGIGVTRSSTGAVAGNGSANFNGTADGSVLLPVGQYGPQTFTIQAWVKTNSTQGGQIIDFGAAATGVSTSADRTLYMGSTGKIYFLTAPGGVNKPIATTGSFNDNQWHQITATLSSSGQRLYVDGVLQASGTSTTAAKIAYGYWRVGGDTVTGFTGAGSVYFTGGIDEVAVYPTALSASQISSIYATRAQAVAAPAAAGARIAVVEEAPATSTVTSTPSSSTVTSPSTSTATSSTTATSTTTAKSTTSTSTSSTPADTTAATTTSAGAPAGTTGATGTGTAGAAATQPTTSTVVTTTGR